MPTISTVLFDAGGVFVTDGRSQRTIQAFAQHFNVPEEKVYEAWFTVWKPYEKNEISGETFWKTIYDSVGIPLDVAKGFDLYKSVISEIKGTREIATELKGKYTLILANNEPEEFDRIRNEVAPYWDLFDHRCSSWIIRKSKPDTSFFSTILTQHNLRPEECLFIDDKKQNIGAAKSLGIQGIQFIDAQQLRAAMVQLGLLT